tara:strand:+ start:246 stop:695 length:450 start_codon:yes stop_codon:yes gene_type:complete
MHHEIMVLIVIVAVVQSVGWMARKKILINKKLNIQAIKMFESTLITLFLLTYILSTTSFDTIKETYHLLTKTEMAYMCFVAVTVVISVTIVFYLIRKVDVSKLSPSISILRIILLSILGFLIFGEKITMKKIIALIFMITGITLLMSVK